MENQKEIWKTINGYEGLYEISNLGRVKSLSKTIKSPRGFRITKEKILIKNIVSTGYHAVALCYNNNRKPFRVHRLVANAFITNSKNKPCVNHINGIKTDNRSENLEWCNQSENMNHAFKNNLYKPIFGESYKSKLTEKEVLEIKSKENKIIVNKILAKKYNISPTTISDIKNNKTWKHL